jgi:ferric-dicitrate binding protein FerR (iron transport regulator)
MFGKVKKLSRRSKGMEALQAVLLIGGAFVVVWGLMAIWKGVQPKLQTAIEEVATGQKQTK